MGNIKGVILVLGLVFVLLNFTNIKCQNIKGVKPAFKNGNVENEKKGVDVGNVKGKESSPILVKEATAEKQIESKEPIVSASKVESINKESVVTKENISKQEGSTENSKDVHLSTKGAFIEGDKEKAESTNVVPSEPKEKTSETKSEDLVVNNGEANLEAAIESIQNNNIETEQKEIEMINAEKQNVDMDEVPIKKEPVQESNLYFLQMLAFFSSIFMQLTSIPTVFKILKKKSTGELDGLAYVMLLYSSFLWLVYGMLIENTAVVLPNFSGLTLGFIYTVSYHKYCKNMWLKQKLYSYYKICGLVTFLMYVFIYFMTFEQYVLSAGLLASVSSVINFGAPLSSLREVIKKRDTASIPLEMTLGSLTCSFLWLLYGMTLRDAFLIIPNLGGFLLGLMQIVLIVIYANKDSMQFIVDESCFKEEKDSYRPGGNFYPDNIEDYDNKISDVSTSVHESFFDFTYDETSPLTSDANFILKQNVEKNENALKSATSIKEDTVLNF